MPRDTAPLAPFYLQSNEQQMKLPAFHKKRQSMPRDPSSLSSFPTPEYDDPDANKLYQKLQNSITNDVKNNDPGKLDKIFQDAIQKKIKEEGLEEEVEGVDLPKTIEEATLLSREPQSEEEDEYGEPVPMNGEFFEEEDEEAFVGAAGNDELDQPDFKKLDAEFENDDNDIQALEDEFGSSEDLMRDNVVNEVHPKMATWEGFKSRAVVKNLSRDPLAAQFYLNKEHSDLAFVHDQDGNLMIQDYTQYYPLDPEGFDIQDFTDVGGDLVTGGIGAAASAVGGLYGGLPGAMALGGITDAATETAVQGFGKMAGIPQDFSGEDIAMSGVTGALLPNVTGTGLTKKAAKEWAEYMGKSTAETEALIARQRGFIGRGFGKFADSMAPKVAHFINNKFSPKIYKMMGESLDSLRAAQKAGDDTTLNYQKISDMVIAENRKLSARMSKMFGDTIKKQKFVINTIKKIKIPGTKETKIGILGPLHRARNESVRVVEEAIASGASKSDVAILKKELREVKSMLDRAIATPKILDGPGIIELRKRLKDMTKIGRPLDTQFSSFSAPSKNTAMMAAKESLDALDDVLMNSEVKEMFKEYTELYALRKNIHNAFKDKKTTMGTLKKLVNTDEHVLRGDMKRMRKEFGIDVFDDANKRLMEDGFINPSWRPKVMNVPMHGTGVMAGMVAGMPYGYTMAALGAAMGGGASLMASSPKAIRAMARAGRFSNRHSDTPFYLQRSPSIAATVPKVWRNLDKDGTKKKGE